MRKKEYLELRERIKTLEEENMKLYELLSHFGFKTLLEHFNHKIVIVKYEGLEGFIYKVSIECNDCSEVLVDYDNPLELEDEE